MGRSFSENFRYGSIFSSLLMLLPELPAACTRASRFVGLVDHLTKATGIRMFQGDRGTEGLQ